MCKQFYLLHFFQTNTRPNVAPSLLRVGILSYGYDDCSPSKMSGAMPLLSLNEKETLPVEVQLFEQTIN
jgi:hypothetical protein